VTIAVQDPLLAERLSSKGARWSQSDDGTLRSVTWQSKTRQALALGARLPPSADGSFDVGLATAGEAYASDPGDFVIRFTHPGAKGAPAALDDARAGYTEIAPATDLVFISQKERVEWFYVLKSPAASANIRIDTKLPSGLPQVKSASDGSLSFFDTHGKARLRMPSGIAVDARGVRRDVVLRWDAATSHLDVSIDAHDLTYPIVIDPSVEYAIWQQVGSTTPASRASGGMAFDPLHGKTVAFGGSTEDGSGTLLSDTWLWDGSTWQNPIPATSPAGRGGPAMAYDSALQRVVMFGGIVHGALTNETWEWDGATWRQLSLTTVPPDREVAGMVYDSARNVMVLFGGEGGNGPLNDTWELSGTIWTQRSPTNPPPAREGCSMVYDAARGNTLLFGGWSGGYSGLTDTWTWNGTTWTQLSPATSPSGRYFAGAEYDGIHQNTVLFGGSNFYNYLSDTWLWNGTNWQQQTPLSSPSARGQPLTSFDSARGKVVLFGGQYNAGLADTWEWSGSNWSVRQANASPSPRNGGALTYDQPRSQTLLFGGDSDSSATNDTWQWNGALWSQSTSSGPSARQHAMVASSGSHSYLYGGDAEANFDADFWVWSGSWSRNSASATPGTRTYGSMTYDSQRSKLVVYGGINGSYAAVSDTWEWDTSAERQLHLPMDDNYIAPSMSIGDLA
jgi:hypothetical protein